MSRDAEILDQLRAIIDPDLGRDIVSLGFIKNLTHDEAGRVAFAIELTTPACPVKEQFRRQAEEAVRQLSWVTKVDVTMTASPRRSAAPAAAAGLAGVKNILAVSSCKGGVGKSTIAVNLAYTLARQGAQVGIFDADVYGPSLPTLVSPENRELYQVNDLIQPLVYEGVKLMSFGFVNTGAGGGGPAIMRGPMVTSVINQLLTGTEWGELDYLVIDFPPGTGDIQLTLLQIIPITAAVIVTTPQELSFVDVVKGIQMFDKLKVPAIAVVENMSYFECETCSTKHHLFGQGARRKLVEQFGIANSFELPLVPDVSRLGDAGHPITVVQPGGRVALAFSAIGEAVVREVSRIRYGADRRPAVTYDPLRGVVIQPVDGAEKVISAPALRRSCRCAMCVDEFTGAQKLKPEDVAETVHPTSISGMGNYAASVQWSDGHSSIFPHEQLMAMPATG